MYNKIANIYYFFVCLRNFIYAKIKGKPDDFKSIPIIINNRNRYTFLVKLLESLEERGYNNIHILDNKSTYPPLLEFYKSCKYEIYMLDKNYGFKALELSGLIKKFKYNYFVYTDPDLLISEKCPDNFLEIFYKNLALFPFVQKVGFSLKIDDLPNHFAAKEQVINWEKQFYFNEIDKGIYIAPIDTTFALHRPLASISTQGRFKNIRMGSPFEMHHMPWYNDSKNLSTEEDFYIHNVEIGTQWSTGAGYANKSFFQRILNKK